MNRILITETESGSGAIVIKVDGILDRETVPVLSEVCERHIGRYREVRVNLEGIIHVTREGREFLQQQQKRLILVNPPLFLDLLKEETPQA